MVTATHNPAKKRTTENSHHAEVERLRNELEFVQSQLEQSHAFFAQIQKFSDLLVSTKKDLKQMKAIESEQKADLKETKAEIKLLENLIDSSNSGMLAILEPGPSDFFPLFDQMEKAEPKKHGKNANEWREKPISVLRLSPIASSSLVDAGFLFIGQLQDAILENPNIWWEDIAGLDDAIAAAVMDKLTEFIAKGGDV